MSEISIIDIPNVDKPFENLSDIQKVHSPKEKGLIPTSENNDTIIYHSYSTPNFLETQLLRQFNLTDGYTLKYQTTNYGHTTKKLQKVKPNVCKECETKIAIGQPMIRLTKQEMIEYDYGRDKGTRPIFRSWLFGSEECLLKWLRENNPEDMI